MQTPDLKKEKKKPIKITLNQEPAQPVLNLYQYI